MNSNEFKEKIYGPYSDTWKIVKLLQYAGDGGFKEEQVDEYWKAVERFGNDYQGNEFAEFMKKSVLLHADTIIVRMNERGNHEKEGIETKT